MKIRTTLLLLSVGLSVSALAQNNDSQPQSPSMHKQPPMMEEQMTVSQINDKMVTDLKLTEKQAKKVKKLNKKYAAIIEGNTTNKDGKQGRPSGPPPGGNGQRPQGGPGGMGGPNSGMGGRPGGPQGGPGMSADSNSKSLDEQQEAYEKKLKKILSEEQYEGYKNIRPQFFSQKVMRRFLQNGEQDVK